MSAPRRATPPTTETPTIKPVWPPLLLEDDVVLSVAEAAGAVLDDVTAASVCVMTTVDPEESVVLESTLEELVTVAVDWYEVVVAVVRKELDVVGVKTACDDDEVVGAAVEEDVVGAAVELTDVWSPLLLSVLSVPSPPNNPNCLGDSLLDLRIIWGLFWAGNDASCAEAAATRRHKRGTLALIVWLNMLCWGRGDG